MFILFLYLLFFTTTLHPAQAGNKQSSCAGAATLAVPPEPAPRDPAIVAYQEPFLHAITQARRVITPHFYRPGFSKQIYAARAGALCSAAKEAFTVTDDPVLKMAIRFVWCLTKDTMTAYDATGRALPDCITFDEIPANEIHYYHQRYVPPHISFDDIPMNLFFSLPRLSIDKGTVQFDCSCLPDAVARDVGFIQLALDMFGAIIDTQPDLIDAKTIGLIELLGGPVEHEFTITSSAFGWYKRPL